MSEVISAFGIDWRLIVIQIFNFVLLAAALWYFLYTPVLRIIEERRQKIAQGVFDADKAKEELAEANQKRKDIITSAEADADGIITRAREYGEEKGKEIENTARKQAAHTLNEAKERGEEIKAQAQKESEAEIAKVAILATEKLLREKIG